MLLVFTLGIFTACGPQEEDPANQQTTEVVEEESHQPITLQLIALVDNNPEIREMLEASIAKAKEVNPDTIMNPVQNLDDYYSYIDRALEAYLRICLNALLNFLCANRCFREFVTFIFWLASL